jgi:acetoacetate decarboxylase
MEEKRMSLKFEKNEVYSMPVFFGPSSLQVIPGKHQPDPTNHDHFYPGDNHSISITFETERGQLEKMIPDCYTLIDPYISVSVVEFTNLGWLAGHTYNLINVTCPVRFDGIQDHLDGDLVMVMFENHPDPIIGGRETMGYSKVYCEIPRICHIVKDNEDMYVATASEWDFRFMKMQIDLKKPSSDEARIKANAARSSGKVHYKYIPDVNEKEDVGKVPNFTRPAIAYPTILPKWVKPADYPYPLRVPEVQFYSGSIEFYEPTWEDMPTYYNVAKGLADLKVTRILGAQRTRYDEPCEYSACYKLR